MKILGHSNDGGLIIELSKEEAKELFLAEAAMDGRPSMEVWAGGMNERPTNNCKLSNLFIALRGWIICKFAVNDLQKAVNLCTEVLTKGEK